MPDKRHHRGPHPEDVRLFERAAWPALQSATHDLSWLLTRHYAIDGALKLVGDRFQLQARQRLAVRRSACSDQSLQHRTAACLDTQALAGRCVNIDGFNLLTTIEAALAGGVLLLGRDGCLRDMASMHGSYRQVDETMPGLRLIGEYLASAAPCRCLWWLDRPVSNSGRIGQLIDSCAERHGWPWEVRLVTDPDPCLQQSADVAMTADSVILDACRAWANVARDIVARNVPEAHIVPLGTLSLSPPA